MSAPSDVLNRGWEVTNAPDTESLQKSSSKKWSLINKQQNVFFRGIFSNRKSTAKKAVIGNIEKAGSFPISSEMFV